MSDRNFTGSTLLLVAHGSSVNRDSAVAAQLHACALRRAGLFAEVQVAFWKEPPFIRDVAAALRERTVIIAPLFLSDGYFTRQLVPRELGLTSDAVEPPLIVSIGTATWIYTAPFGTHPRMTDVLLDRAREVSASVETRDAALFIAAHGTPKNDQSRKAAEWHAEQIASRRLFAEVHTIFIEEEPRIDRCFEMTTRTDIVMVPFFVSDGMHACEDIPVFLGESPETVKSRLAAGQPTWTNPIQRHEKRVWYSRSVGTSPLVPELILARIHEAFAHKSGGSYPQ